MRPGEEAGAAFRPIFSDEHAGENRPVALTATPEIKERRFIPVSFYVIHLRLF